jgi:hypothetical protein
MELRTNLEMAHEIENGLVVDEVQGSVAAWAYLEGHGIPSPIIARVLLSSARRRATNPSHSQRSV